MSYHFISKVPVLAHLRSKRFFRFNHAIYEPKSYILNTTVDECLEASNQYLKDNHDLPITRDKLLQLLYNNGIKALI
jgi:hypothetical protein